MKPVFDLHQAAVTFGGVEALKSLDLAIHPGERVALVGANGSGKSTLLRLLHGLIEPSAGHIDRLPREHQAMLFQRPWMLRMSVRNNVALGLWLAGKRWSVARAQAIAALDRVRLSALSERNARTLSGGQQQRLALARAWARNPQVLLLDEPTASLDPGAKNEVEGLIAEFGEQPGVAVVFASHNLGQVKRLASRVIYLEHGRLIADLPVHDFFHGPLPEEARLFVQGELL